MSSELMTYFVMMLAPRLPVDLLLIVGIVIGLARHNRHPRVSLLAAIGLALLLAWSLISAILLTIGQSLLVHNNWTVAQLGRYYAGVNALGVLVNVAAWTCLLIALYGWRQQ